MKTNLLKITGLCASILLSTSVFSMHSDGQLITGTLKIERLLEREQIRKTVTGIVIDDTNTPTAGVGVKNLATGKTTVTDANGKFSIETNSDDDVLQFTFIGFKTQNVKVGNNTTLSIKLLSDSTNLNQVVVIGYGSLNKDQISSAVTKVDSSGFRQSGSRNPMDLLIGKVAGLQVTRTGGTNPNSGVSIQLRGVTSISGSQSTNYY